MIFLPFFFGGGGGFDDFSPGKNLNKGLIKSVIKNLIRKKADKTKASSESFAGEEKRIENFLQRCTVSVHRLL